MNRRFILIAALAVLLSGPVLAGQKFTDVPDGGSLQTGDILPGARLNGIGGCTSVSGCSVSFTPAEIVSKVYASAPGSTGQVCYNSSGSLTCASAATIKGLLALSASDVGLGSVENAAASGLYVPLTRTVNGHALSANVTVTASDLSLATVATSGAYADLTGTPTIDTLVPTQTGNSGKFLTTNGSAVSWGSISAGALSTLTDVTLTSPADKDVLKYDSGSGKWINGTILKSEVGLGAVENTALSTWAGSTNLTTLGAFTATGTGSASLADAATQPGIFTGGGSPVAGRLYGIAVIKSGVEEALLGVNKNSTTNSVPASALYLSTYTSNGRISIGRGDGAGLPGTQDIAIDSSGNVTLGGDLTVSGTLNGYVPATRTVNGHALSGNISVTASDLGLGSVENTALSTWPGSTSITTLGTIGTGVWQGTAVADSYIASASTWNAKAASGANTDITSVLLNQTGLVIKGGDSNALTIKDNETLTAGRTLNLKVNDAARTIDLSGNLTVPSAATVSNTNTGDQTITLTGGVTGSGTGSFAATVITNANMTGDVTSVGNATTIAANAVTLAKLATQAANTVLSNATSGTAVPTALSVGSCSTAGSALIWTTNTGFGCNTSVTAAAAPISGITGLGTGEATWLAATPSSANLRTLMTDETGSGALYFQSGDAGTPSAIVLTNATGTAASLTAGAVSLPASLGSSTATTQSASDNSTKVSTTAYADNAATPSKKTIGFNNNSTPTVAQQGGYVRIPCAGTITDWSIYVDAGSATVKVWRVATGTAVPTSGNSINTSGVSISSGTAVYSTTLSDFGANTTIAANDIFGFENTAVSGVTKETFQLGYKCNANGG